MDYHFSISTRNRARLLDTFALGRWNYWFTFVADSLTAFFFLSYELFHRHTTVGKTALMFVLGYLLWGFTEYGFHRWLYHQREGVLGDGHSLHHDEPTVLIAMPWFMTTATAFSLWYLCAVHAGWSGFASVQSGWLLGFVFYSLVHHSHHHWQAKSRWMRGLKAYHRIHHQFPDKNFGVTMRLWDRVFDTQYKRILTQRNHTENLAAEARVENLEQAESLV